MEKILVLEAQRFFSQKDEKHRSANKSCPISLQTGKVSDVPPLILRMYLTQLGALHGVIIKAIKLM